MKSIAQPETPSNNVLYVDDEPENLQTFTSMFRRHFNVLTASSASEGLDLIRHNDIQVVISDQRMPNTTGVQLLEKVRSIRPNAERIILTAYTDSEDIIDAINKGGVSAFVKKPWTGRELGGLINKSLTHYDIRKRSLQLVDELKDHVGDQGQFIVNELQKAVDAQLNVLSLVKAEGLVSNHTEYMNVWENSIAELNKLLARMELLSSSGKPGDPGDRRIADEDLLFVTARFSGKEKKVLQLYSRNDDFRELCQDFRLCYQLFNEMKSNGRSAESDQYNLLSLQLEEEIVEWISV